MAQDNRELLTDLSGGSIEQICRKNFHESYGRSEFRKVLLRGSAQKFPQINLIFPTLIISFFRSLQSCVGSEASNSIK